MKGLKNCLMLLVMSLSAAQLEARELLIVLDASNSMWGQIEGEAKVLIARRALSGLIDDLDSQDQVGLIAYGHRREGDCQDVELIQSLEPLNAPNLKQQINAIDPKGKTPITNAMEAAFAAIKGAESNILLVSDGVETCDADPCAAVKAAKARGQEFKLQVIGFDVDVQAREQLACMAEAGGGRLLTAADSDELVQAMEQASGVQESAGAVVRIVGSANIERQGEILQQVQTDDEVFREDQLRTESGASLDVALIDGSVLELDEDTLLSIQEYLIDPAADSSMYLLRGRLRSTASKAFSKHKDAFRVTTPNAIIGVQGTIFSTLYKDNVTEVFVEDGQVLVRNVDLTIPGVALLNPGEFTRVVADQPPEPVKTPELTINVTLNGAAVDAQVLITDRGREAAKGSAPLVQPLHPGDYLVTATLDDGFNQTAEIKLPADGLQYTVEITRIEAPKPVGVAITAKGPGGSSVTDNLQWLIINQSNEETVTPDTQSGAITIELVPGSYDVLVVADDFEGEAVIVVEAVGSNQFEIELNTGAIGNSFSSPASVPAGEILSFEWSGPTATKDRIFIAEPTLAGNRYMTSNVHMASKGSPAVLVAPALPGSYEVRYFSAANGSVVFRQALEVTASQVRIDAPGGLLAGTEFSVSWEGPNAKGDRLFVASPQMDHNKYYLGSERIHMVSEGATANLIAPVEEGDYEIRYYSAANGRTLAKLNISVAPHAVKIDAPRAIAAGTEFEYSWQGPDATGDFLFIAESDMEANKYYIGAGRLTKHGPTGKFTAPAKPGVYEIRYFSKRNGTALAKRVIMVR